GSSANIPRKPAQGEPRRRDEPGGARLIRNGLLLGRRATASFCLVTAGSGSLAALLDGGAAAGVLAAAVHALGTAAGLCRRRAASLVLGAAGHLGLAAVRRSRLVGDAAVGCEHEAQRENQAGQQFREHELRLQVKEALEAHMVAQKAQRERGR